MPAWFDNIPQFDELYSISDLHMGGDRPEAQIFNAGTELAALIRKLGARPGKIVLVINGDMVDFLAEPDAKPFDPDGAIRKLTRIAADKSFVAVWEALRQFVQTAGHRLAVTLGNHDLELALPWVREHFLDLLAGDDDTARGRIILAFDGAGFLCRAGNATVLCVHGNEIDPWNVTDHEVIRRTGRDLQQGRAVQQWIPNAGTYLVIDVMNDIKKDHPFIDLLKPEREAVLPVLLSVAPEKRDRILSIWPIYQRLRQDTDRLRKGLLGDEDEPSDLRSGPLPPPRPPMDHDALMGETEDLLTRRVEPITLVPDAYSEQTLGLGGALWSWASGGDSRVTLRLALEDLQNDRSFDWRLQDEMFRKFDETVTAGIDFVLCGHTHLERALPRRKGSGFYFNSGTWVRLIQLKPEVLGDQQAFNKVYDALAAGTMEALDTFKDLVLRPRTVIAVRPGATGSRGELLHWDMASGELIKVADEAGKTKT